MVMIGRAYSVGFGVFCWFVCLFGVFARWCMQVSVQVGIPVCTHTRTQRTQQDIKCRPLTLCVVKCSLLCLKIVKLWCTRNPEGFFFWGGTTESEPWGHWRHYKLLGFHMVCLLWNSVWEPTPLPLRKVGTMWVWSWQAGLVLGGDRVRQGS